MQDRRVLIPICVAIVLTIVCTMRIATNKRQDYADQVAVAVVTRPAPGFEALDSGNRLVRLGSFLGRHKIIVVFFENDITRDDESVNVERLRAQFRDLIVLRDRFEEFQSAGVKVVAISSAIPQLNRAAMTRLGTFPFPLVSDFDPTSPEGALRIHRQWGRLDGDTGKPKTGVFVVDRKGQLSYGVEGPKPVPNVEAAIETVLK